MKFALGKLMINIFFINPNTIFISNLDNLTFTSPYMLSYSIQIIHLINLWSLFTLLNKTWRSYCFLILNFNFITSSIVDVETILLHELWMKVNTGNTSKKNITRNMTIAWEHRTNNNGNANSEKCQIDREIREGMKNF